MKTEEPAQTWIDEPEWRNTVAGIAERMAEQLKVLQQESLKALVKAAGGFEQAILEVQASLGKPPGGLGSVVELSYSRRWAVAGRWLVSDEFAGQPLGLWGRVLAGMVQGVKSGRHLREPGF